MTVRYHRRADGQVPDYVCQGRRVQDGEPVCQSIPGRRIDEAITGLVVETMTPLALEVALAVEEEIEARAEQDRRIHAQEVEQLRHEVELARRRYVRVDPDHRLVADALEADWNEKLRAFTTAQEAESLRAAGEKRVIDEQCRAKILALAADVPRLFRDAATPARERKRMARLLIEDVTLRRGDEDVVVDVRFKGGATRSIRAPLPPSIEAIRRTNPAIVAKIDEWMEDHTDEQIAARLNQEGYRSVDGALFHRRIVYRLQRDYELRSRFERLRARGMFTLAEFAKHADATVHTVTRWCEQGLVRARAYNAKGQCLVAPRRTETHTSAGRSSRAASVATVGFW